jgi:hypothetical protein
MCVRTAHTPTPFLPSSLFTSTSAYLAKKNSSLIAVYYSSRYIYFFTHSLLVIIYYSFQMICSCNGGIFLDLILYLLGLSLRKRNRSEIHR